MLLQNNLYQHSRTVVVIALTFIRHTAGLTLRSVLLIGLYLFYQQLQFRTLAFKKHGNTNFPSLATMLSTRHQISIITSQTEPQTVYYVDDQNGHRPTDTYPPW